MTGHSVTGTVHRQDLTAGVIVLLSKLLLAIVGGFWLYSVFYLYQQGSVVFALVWLGTLSAVCVVYFNRRFQTARFLFPTLAAVSLFVLLPIVMTAFIGFTNYSGRHLIDQQRAYTTVMQVTIASESERMNFALADIGNNQTALLLTDVLGRQYVSQGFELSNEAPDTVIRFDLTESNQTYQTLAIRAVARNRNLLQKIEVYSASGQRYMMSSFREFSAMELRYQSDDINVLTDKTNGTVYTANFDTGFYENEKGEQLTPGFYVNVGFDNFVRTLTDKNISEPFWAIFVWTVIFAFLTVLLTLFTGLPLACFISVKNLRFAGFYRVMLILPYAVPAFISILVFKGLFNQSFGEINIVLQNLFGIAPQWFDDPVLAKIMVLIVNTWLGYPYVMVLSLGLLKTIPEDLYEASALEGASVLSNFFKITFPLVMKPLAPLMVASFAFNFNNFVIIALLTKGGPDFLNTTTPAGHTDLLVSYTYRMAFQDQGQNFALAASISMLIFVLVGVLAMLNLKLAKVKV